MILGKQVVIFSKSPVSLSELPREHGTQYHAGLVSVAVIKVSELDKQSLSFVLSRTSPIRATDTSSMVHGRGELALQRCWKCKKDKYENGQGNGVVVNYQTLI